MSSDHIGGAVPKFRIASVVPFIEIGCSLQTFEINRVCITAEIS